MIRTFVVLAVGALLGVAATWLLVSQRDSRPALDDSPLALFSADPITPAPASAPAASADFYRRLADADTAELARMIAEADGAPPSTDRELVLAVLLKRHAELDVVGAVRLARDVGVRGAALGTVYSAWARRAPAQVLAALSTIGSPDDAADVALALIVTLGNDARAVERVGAVLAERRNETSVLAGTASFSPFIAPNAGPATFAAPRSALALLAARWVELDPRNALATAREIGDERIRHAFEAAALQAFARVAPDEAFAQIAAFSGDSAQLGVLAGVLVELARADPDRLLSYASELRADLRSVAQAAAMQHLAERDLGAALGHLERMPPGPQRQQFVRLIAYSYGKRDAEAALEWARSVPGQPNLVAAVISGVAEQDANRALDLALGLTSPTERMQALQFAAGFGGRTDAEAEAIANRLLAVEDANLRDSVAFNVVATWAIRSPDGAMRWLLANGQAAPPHVFQQVGQLLAMRDPSDAVAYAGQIPAAAREAWINGVAVGYAQNDPQGAVGWLQQYRAEPWYDQTAGTIATNLAQRDGAAAARLVDELDTERIGAQAQQIATMVAMNWANTDPAAAAAWAADRRTEAERTMAVRSVVGTWSSQDFDGARQWTLRLPQGAARDAALAMLLTTSAYSAPGGLDPGLLNAFGSDSARQLAVMQIVQGLAYNDPARARSIVDSHVTTPEGRAQAERMIEAASNNGGRPRPGMGIAGGVRAIPPSVVLQRQN